MTSNQAFLSLFDNTKITVPFNTEWHNGSGYLNDAVHFQIEPGYTVKTVDDKGRKIVLMGTEIGTLVLFQLYSDSHDTTVAYNAPAARGRVLLGMSACGTLSSGQLRYLMDFHPQSEINTQKKFREKASG